jgi:hypothetical protein
LSEASEAARDGARLQKNSGRGKHQKADAIWLDMSVDYKEVGKQFSVSVREWTKTCKDALSNGLDMVPVIKIVLGQPGNKVRLALVSWDYLEYLKSCEQQVEAYNGKAN